MIILQLYSTFDFLLNNEIKHFLKNKSTKRKTLAFSASPRDAVICIRLKTHKPLGILMTFKILTFKIFCLEMIGFGHISHNALSEDYCQLRLKFLNGI